MQRNWELVRKILVQMEEQDGPEGWLEPTSVQGFDPRTVINHMLLLSDAGFICVKRAASMGTSEVWCAAIGLTWDGHEFLDRIRKDAKGDNFHCFLT